MKRVLRINVPEKDFKKYSQDELRRFEIINYICLISVFNLIVYSIIYALLDFDLFRVAIVSLIVFSLLTIGIIILNYKGFHQTARVSVSALLPFYIAYTVIYLFGKAPGFQVYLLIAANTPVFLWSYRNRDYLFIFIVINLLLYIYLEFFSIFLTPKIIMPEHYANAFRSTNIIVCFLAVASVVAFYQILTNRNERQIMSQAKQLKIVQAHKDKVYSIIAHDLKGPISSLAGLSNAYLKDYQHYDEEKRKKVFVLLKDSTSFLQILLENLLDWSKVQSGLISNNYVNFNFRESLDVSLSLYRDVIGKKQLKVEVNVDSEIVVFADTNMISTVIRNLLSNAIKFTPAKGEIVISALNNGKEILVCIADSGVGMSEQDVSNVFNIEKSIDNPVNDEDKGSGLGLLICKDFIDINKGKIWAESELGKGTRFYFTLVPGEDSI